MSRVLFFRLFTAILLFVGIPSGTFYLLSDQSFSQEEELLRTRAIEKQMRDVRRVVCANDPRYFFVSRFAELKRQMLKNSSNPDKIRRLWKKAMRVWGVSFEANVFGVNGRLVSPPDMPCSSRFLMQRIWNTLRSPTVSNVEEYRRHLPAMRKLLGSNFGASQLGQRIGNIWTTKTAGGREALVFPDFDFLAPGAGGVIFIVWQLPSWQNLLENHVRRLRDKTISLFFKERDGTIRQLSSHRNNSDAPGVVTAFLQTTDSACLVGNKLWVRITSGDTVIYYGKVARFLQTSTKRIVHASVAFIALFVSFFLFRGIVLGKDTYISIRIKLMALFLYAVLLPSLGIGFMARQMLHDRFSVQMAEGFKGIQEVTLGIDQDFSQAKLAFMDECRRLRDSVASGISLAEMASSANQLHLGHYELRDIQGRIQLEGGEYTVNRSIYEMFSSMAIEKHLPEKLQKSIANGARPPSHIGSAFIEDSASDLLYVIERPDAVHTIQFSNFPDTFYFDVIRDERCPTAFLTFSKGVARLIHEYVSKRFKRRETFKQAVVRLFCSNDSLPIWHPSNVDIPQVVQELAHRALSLQDIVQDKLTIQGRTFLAIGFPGRNLKGHTLVALYPQDEIDRSIASLRNMTGTGLFIVIIVALLIALRLSDTFLGPFGEINKGIIAVKESKTRYRLPPLGKDELGDLAVAFNHMMENLHETSLGRQIQTRLLPAKKLLLGDYGIFGMSQTATQLGGDYFDYLPTADGNLLVIVGDVTGHGIPSALVMAMSKALFVDHAAGGKPPENLIESLNRVILQTMDKALFMTACILWIDVKTHAGKMFNCGHPFPFISSSDGSPVQMTPEKMRFIGWRSEIPIECTPFQLEPGQRLILYTDGAIESLPAPEGSDGFSDFSNLLRKPLQAPLEEAVKNIFDVHPAISCRQPLPDDLTIVVIERRASAAS
ncbi:MAG: SpoIIE family protein phosphatase [Candidatus Ozemobacteraceae bacterium]